MTTGVSVPTPLVFRGVRTRGMRGSLYSHVHCPFLCSVNSWNDTQLDETQVLNVWTAALSGYTMSRLSDALLTNWCIHSGNSTKGYTWGFMQCCKVFKRPNFFFLFPLRIVSFSLKQESICFIHGCNCVSYFLNQPSCRVLFGSRLGLKKILLHCVGEMVGDEQQPASNGVIIVSSQWLFIPSQITFTKLRNYGWVWAWWCLHKLLPKDNFLRTLWDVMIT